MNSPLVCVVIVNWNGGETTYNCIRTLRKTNYNNYKVVVVDNGSTDGSLQYIKSHFKECDLFPIDKNLGYAKGLNSGWNYCLDKYNPDYICNMSDDIITTQEEWLTLMVEELEKDRLRGICGNKLTFPDGRLQLLYLGRDYEDFSEMDNNQYDFVKEVKAVGGANLLVKRELINELGGTDENYFHGPDDIDYCLRAGNIGWKIVYTGLSKSIHIGSFSYLSAGKDFIYKHQSYGQTLFYFRHHGIKGGLRMIRNQFIRAFITRKNPFKKWSMDNVCFHWSFIKRLISLVPSSISAFRDRNNIANKYFLAVEGEKK